MNYTEQEFDMACTCRELPERGTNQQGLQRIHGLQEAWEREEAVIWQENLVAKWKVHWIGKTLRTLWTESSNAESELGQSGGKKVSKRSRWGRLMGKRQKGRKIPDLSPTGGTLERIGLQDSPGPYVNTFLRENKICVLLSIYIYMWV